MTGLQNKVLAEHIWCGCGRGDADDPFHCVECGAEAMCPHCGDQPHVVENHMPAVLRGIAPRVGTQWWWEPEKPHARVLVEVTAVKWNGEAVWIETRNVERDDGKRHWNELDRWVEATVLHSTPEGD